MHSFDKHFCSENTLHKNFITYATAGDIIYSLCAIKILGGGNLYLKLGYLDEFCRNVLGWWNQPNTGRITEKDFQNIKPLLNSQNYLHSVDIHNNQSIDYDLAAENWKFILPAGWQGNQTQAYALGLGWDMSDMRLQSKLLREPWLTPVDATVIPNKPFVINRTPRHRDNSSTQKWVDFINKGLCEQAVFVGTEKEHQDWQIEFNASIDYFPTKDLLHLAQIIQGCQLFIGNQSAPLALAIGLGKSYWCEGNQATRTRTPLGGFGDCWFERINGYYF